MIATTKLSPTYQINIFTILKTQSDGNLDDAKATHDADFASVNSDEIGADVEGTSDDA